MTAINTLTGAILNPADDAAWNSPILDEGEVRRLMGSDTLVVWPLRDFYAVRPVGSVIGALYYGQLSDLATVQRAGEAIDLDWSGISGDVRGQTRIVAADAARFNRHGVIGTDGGSNLVSNPWGEGAPPTNWSTTAGLTFQGVGFHADDTPYAEYSMLDNSALEILTLDTLGAYAAVQNDNLQMGLDIQIVSGSIADLDFNLSFREGLDSGAQTSNNELTGGKDDALLARGGLRRVKGGFTVNHADTENVTPRLIVRGSGTGQSVVCRFGLPQVARGLYLPAFTRPAPSTLGSSNSIGDDIFIPGGDWLGEAAHTLMVCLRPLAVKSAFQYAVTLHAGSTNDVMTLGLSSVNERRLFARGSATSTVVDNVGAPVAAGDRVRMAASLDAAGWNFAADGEATVAGDINNGLPGFGPGAGLQIGGYVGASTARADAVIEEIRYGPDRRSAAALDDFAQTPASILEA